MISATLVCNIVHFSQVILLMNSFCSFLSLLFIALLTTLSQHQTVFGFVSPTKAPGGPPTKNPTCKPTLSPSVGGPTNRPSNSHFDNLYVPSSQPSSRPTGQ